MKLTVMVTDLHQFEILAKEIPTQIRLLPNNGLLSKIEINTSLLNDGARRSVNMGTTSGELREVIGKAQRICKRQV